jgi:undecaprenyl-diphosphatase
MRYVHDRSGLVLDAPMTGLSVLGGGVGLMVIVVGTVVALARAGRGADALFLGVAVAGAEVITRVAKPIVARPRPELWEHGYPASGYAFPSGHTTSSMALAAAVTVLAWNTRWRWWALAGGALFTFGVGVSRVYLGVHYPSDVIAGWCLGVAWVSVLILLRAAERRAGRRAGNVPP